MTIQVTACEGGYFRKDFEKLNLICFSISKVNIAKKLANCLSSFPKPQNPKKF